MTEEEIMLTSILNCRRVDLYTDRQSLTQDQEYLLSEMKQRRALGEPLQYILGTTDFMGLELKVSPNVLVPRPETEILVEHALQDLKQRSVSRELRILDLGTGSGNIAIALAKNLKDCKVTAVDVSEQALVLAQKNAHRHHVSDKVQLVCEDMSVYCKRAMYQHKRFDMIISNPPYIPTSEWEWLPSEVLHEPRLALDGGPDGMLFYRKIISYGAGLLVNGGVMNFEIGDNQRHALENILKVYPEFEPSEYIKDYRKTDRVLSVRLRPSRLKRKPSLTVSSAFESLTGYGQTDHRRGKAS